MLYLLLVCIVVAMRCICYVLLIYFMCIYFMCIYFMCIYFRPPPRILARAVTRRQWVPHANHLHEECTKLAETRLTQNI